MEVDLKRFRNMVMYESDAIYALIEKVNPVDILANLSGCYAADADFDCGQGPEFQAAMQRLVEACNFAIEVIAEDWGPNDYSATTPYLMESRCFKLRSPASLELAPFMESFLKRGDGLADLIMRLAKLHDSLPKYREFDGWDLVRTKATEAIERHLGAEIDEAERVLAEILSPPFDYHAYLLSPEWKTKRDERVIAAGRRCQVCNSPHLLECHHRTYERIGNELPEDLFVLCRECHQTFHDNGRLARR